MAYRVLELDYSTPPAADQFVKFDGTKFVPSSIGVTVSDAAYGSGWNANTDAPSKNAVYDKIEAVIATIPGLSDAVYGSGWDGVTTIAPSKNAVYDKIEAVLAVITALGIAQGTYTPTLTNVANLDASTAYLCTYFRVLNFVGVIGAVDVDPTTTLTATQLGISLPVVSDFTLAQQCGGVAVSPNIVGQCMAIYADATNNRAEMGWKAADVTNQGAFFCFGYRVI